MEDCDVNVVKLCLDSTEGLAKISPTMRTNLRECHNFRSRPNTPQFDLRLRCISLSKEVRHNTNNQSERNRNITKNFACLSKSPCQSVQDREDCTTRGQMSVVIQSSFPKPWKQKPDLIGKKLTAKKRCHVTRNTGNLKLRVLYR